MIPVPCAMANPAEPARDISSTAVQPPVAWSPTSSLILRSSEIHLSQKSLRMPALRWLGALAVFAAVVSVSKAPALANGAATAWPQATSDIPAQPDVRFGTLANGMRYAILHNATPTGQAAIRFRI